jgi:hypothetical protein
MPGCEAERNSVQLQLDRILAHPSFRHSKRYPNLLRYVVEHTLSGQGQLKERTLGVEVFGRDPDYDTNEDPVVRITAGEIRKRIAQYYHEPGHENELRIDLPSGCYVPEFHLPNHASAPAPILIPLNSAPILPRSRGWLGKHWLAYTILAVASIAAITGAAMRPGQSERSLDAFWEALLASSGPALVCIGEPNQQSQPLQQINDDSVSDHIFGADHIAFSDANALFHLAEFLGSRGKSSRLQPAMATSLTDLRQGPVVLVAGIDNPWTIRIAQPLQYHFGFIMEQKLAWIEDRANPSRRDWAVNFGEKYSELTQDYAIVARFYDATSGQPVIIAAGLGENGTIAAGEFLTDEKNMQEVAKRVPSDWRRKNVEVVIATQVIYGKSGPPRVLAAHSW